MEMLYDGQRHAGLQGCFAGGRTRAAAWRLAQLEGLERFLRECEHDIARALAADLGKPASEAYLTETAWLLSESRYARRHLKGWMRPRRIPVPFHYLPCRAQITREPLGVVLIMAAWNYPLQLCLAPLIGALSGGNCAVVKPSELAPETSHLLAARLPGYLDPEAVQVVEGGAAQVAALFRHRFDHLFFTGSRQKGQEAMLGAARHLTPVTLELGGKCPCIVTETANLPVAARRIVWAKFLNAGQTCICPDYLLVHAAVEARLLALMREALQEFYGADSRESPDYARIVDERNCRRLAGYFAEGEVVVGGQVDEASRYVAPTILRGISPESVLMREELFGPVLPVLAVGSMAEAVAVVRAMPEPLAAYLFSGDPADLDLLREQTRSGGICCNDLLLQASVHGLPFGGRGPSGLGSYHGHAGFETFTLPRSLLERTGFPDPSLRYPPYSAGKMRLLRMILNLFS